MAMNLVNPKEKNGFFDPNKPMFPISVVADLLKVHQRTLRIYDDESILSPSRSPKNRRLYSFNDIERGKFIQYLTRALGINLAGIKIIIYLLQQQKINPKDYLDYLNRAAKEINLFAEGEDDTLNLPEQKRGRKPANKE